MSKFKKGDRVWVNYDYPENKPRVFKGQQAIVLRYEAEYDGPTNTLIEVLFDDGRQYWMFEYRFELVSGNEQLVVENKMKFDMKENGWYIRYNNEEEFNLVQEWLQENYGDNLDCHFVSRSEYVTNVASTGYIFDTLKHGSTENIASYAKEIKLNFKTVVDSVEWPEVETEAQKELAKLQKQIEELSAQAEKLKASL